MKVVVKSIIVCFLVSIVIGLIGCSESKPPTANTPKNLKPSWDPAKVRVAGRATMTYQTKFDSNAQDGIPISDGIELILIPEAVENEIIEVRNAAWTSSLFTDKAGDGFNHLNLQEISLAAVRHTIAKTTADKNGYFSFTDVPAGKYFLYGAYQTQYAKGYWLIPVEVVDGKLLEISVNNESMREVYNRFNR